MPVLCLNEWRYRQSFCRSGTELILDIYAVIGIGVASSAVSITDVVEGLRSTSTILVEFVSALGATTGKWRKIDARTVETRI